MPIKYRGKTYKKFNGAVNAVQKRKKLSKKKASAYVAVVECFQNRNKGNEAHKKRCHMILKNRKRRI